MHSRHNRMLPVLAVCTAAALAAAAQEQRPATPASDAASAPRQRVNASDAQLGLEVQARLVQELGVSNLSALVRRGVATLDGIVPTEDDRRRAEELALDVDGIDSVVNELSVASPTTLAIANRAAAIADRESTDLETAVAERLKTDPLIGARSISVEADQLTNTVTLSGTVLTQEERDRAGQLATEAFPAGQVRNQLEIRQRL